MKCSKCSSSKIFKNCYRRGKQCFRCREYGRQFVLNPKKQHYPPEIKQLCLKMYLNGVGLRGIERVTEIHHTDIMNWIKDAGLDLPDAPEDSEIPEITEIDKLQTLYRQQKEQGLALDACQLLETRHYSLDNRQSH